MGRVAAVMTLMAVIGACGGSSGASHPPTSTQPAQQTVVATTTTLGPGEAEVAAAYHSYWVVVESASDPPNRNDPRLADHATGAGLKALVDHLSQLQQNGLVVRGEVILTMPDGSPSFTFQSFAGDAATLRDCHDASHFLAYDAKSGALRDTVDTRRSLWTVDMVREAGSWKVSNITDHSREDQGRCANGS